MFALDEAWVWDSWVADDGERYHLFFLQAPRSLGDPALRHTRGTVGHAVSTDLVGWEYLGIALTPSSTGPVFDDLAIWTGSVLDEPDGPELPDGTGGRRWRMFYTALSNAGHHVYDQRIGSVTSADLTHWSRPPTARPVTADGRWYKTLASHPGPTTGPDPERSSETWRDPLVFADPDGDGWHLLATARAREGGRNDDGVVAHATSPDLEHWTVGPPLSRPGTGFGQLEVLQHQQIGGRWVLVFTCHPDEMTAERRARTGDFCTWSVPSPGPLGPWDVDAARPFTTDPYLFAAPLVQRRDGSWAILGFRNLEALGQDGFAITDPLPVTLDDDGYLVAVTG